MNLITELRKVEGFNEIPDNQLIWLIDKGQLVRYAAGEMVFEQGTAVEYMQIVLQGRIVLKMQQKDQFRTVSEVSPYSVMGSLPYSKANTASGYSTAMDEVIVFALHKDHFREMIIAHEALTTVLVHHMTTRVRSFTKLQQQNDKMSSLGKLSAGLAHELNNPSSAVIRSAQALSRQLRGLSEKFRNINSIRLSDAQVNSLTTQLLSKIRNGIIQLPVMERSDQEDNIAIWLEEAGFPDGYELAENFVDYDYSIEELDHIRELVGISQLVPVMEWLNQLLLAERTVAEIGEASKRINELVRSVKSYTHMDKAPEKQLSNIHTGLNNTLTMLNHRLKKDTIVIQKKYDEDLEQIPLYVSEINQVWTNLIDNAIDAMEESPKRILTIETKKDNNCLLVTIQDTGSGIPQESLDHIFDPFYTTKEIGKGTGLGLDVVQQIVTQHNGKITVHSQEGETRFMVCLPY